MFSSLDKQVLRRSSPVGLEMLALTLVWSHFNSSGSHAFDENEENLKDEFFRRSKTNREARRFALLANVTSGLDACPVKCSEA